MDGDSTKQPPPIPGMRPPLGSPGGPMPAPKSSMGFVMPIYTICIIVFFVYTLSKILFKRTGTSAYEPITPDPQFRRRVFRDDSRTSPDKLGPKERDTIVTAISGLVAEVQQQMEASYAQNQQRQDVPQDNHSRPYTNGTILHNSGPVHIVASEYQEQAKEKTPEPLEEKEVSPAPEIETVTEDVETENKESTPELEIIESEEPDEQTKPDELIKSFTEFNKEEEPTPEPETNVIESTPELEDEIQKPFETENNVKEIEPVDAKADIEAEEEEAIEEEIEEEEEDIEEIQPVKLKESNEEFNLIKTAATDESVKPDDVQIDKNGDIHRTDEFLKEETNALSNETEEKQSTPELLEDAIKDEKDVEDNEKSSVKHEAESVQSIFLETDIPQQSRVLVAEFEDHADTPQPTRHSPMVVSGKMTLSLIQDAPRDTPERDQESTVDDFTTASAVTQNALEKEGEESDEEIEEEIEIEEIEEEVEEIEEEEKEPIKKTN